MACLADSVDDIFSARRDRDLAEDRISELPDDILLHITSPLQMEDAAKTSIISKRWRYLFAKRTHLDFNHLTLFPETDLDPKFIFATTEQKTKYLNWVNQVVDLHCFPFIDTFKVRFQFDNNVAHHIEKWVRFATSKRVKHLDLELYELTSYNFSYPIGLDVLQPSPCPSQGESDISFLVSLNLYNIDISGDVLQVLLKRCRVLERLRIVASMTLERLKVSGSIKQLIIHNCRNLAELEIDAANLVSLSYFDPKWDSNLVFKSIPMLVDVEVGAIRMESVFPPHLAGQIVKLSLILLATKVPRGFHPTLSSLKQLTLTLIVEFRFDLVAITALLESCQTVRKLKVELAWSFRQQVLFESYVLRDYDVEEDDLEGDDVEVDNVLDLEDAAVPLQRNTLPTLKVLHVSGFIGCDEDVDFILYLLDLACDLDTFICDSTPSAHGSNRELCVETSRSRASKLAKVVPPKIFVEII